RYRQCRASESDRTGTRGHRCLGFRNSCKNISARVTKPDSAGRTVGGGCRNEYWSGICRGQRGDKVIEICCASSSSVNCNVCSAYFRPGRIVSRDRESLTLIRIVDNGKREQRIFAMIRQHLYQGSRRRRKDGRFGQFRTILRV